ncbi:unnamed protein product [Leptidea sinapis]|uniref:Secreted protein n=1 Tax=Leptidea sinapis TaxID=189913 RepID=A0A5E4Q914_9NEOP|nr:unnamed protein product [Leptidea sinapis]
MRTSSKASEKVSFRCISLIVVLVLGQGPIQRCEFVCFDCFRAVTMVHVPQKSARLIRLIDMHSRGM